MKTFSSMVFGGIAVSSVLMSTAPSIASTIVSFTDSTGTDTTRSFSSGDFTLTFSPSSDSPQNYVTSSGNGICLFANTTAPDTTNRCNVLDPQIGTGNLNFVSLTANRSIFLTGGSIVQITGSPGNINLSNTIGGPSLGSINAVTGNFTFNSPVTLNQGQEIIFSGSGTNSALRLQSLTIEDVPGPLPLLGAAAAFGYSRRLRRKTNRIS